jgi:outer membrane protein OmpA-like peptidoglycan-associated protein
VSYQFETEARLRQNRRISLSDEAIPENRSFALRLQCVRIASFPGEIEATPPILRYLFRAPALQSAGKIARTLLEDGMSVCSSISKGRFITGLLAVLVVSLISSMALAQSDSNPKFDVFVGYQWLHPGGSAPTPFGDFNNPIPYDIPDMGAGFGTAFTYNFNPHWGGEFDIGENWGNDNYESTYSIGPRFIWRTDTGNYFLHTLVSLNRVSVGGLTTGNGVGAILGGGMDLPISKRVAFRLFEVDYVWAQHNYADYAAPQFPDLRRPTFEGARLRTGLVFNWGGAPPVAPTASCSVQPGEVLVGEPITATVAVNNFNPKHTVAYAWSGTGGQITGKDTTAQIDTTNAAPGSYTITARVTDAKEKTNNMATCSANFTVKPLPPKNPPTVSISASPTSLQTGGTVNLSANCTSPDNVGVSVANWTTSSGTVSGSGSSATLNTTGVPPGSITVGATCTDTRGLAAQASTAVTIENPPVNPEVAQLEARLSLHSVYFVTDQPRPANPKGGLLASQQKTLIALAVDFKKYLESKPDAKLILGGHADHRGSQEYNQALSLRRVDRVKGFLVEQGIPEANIETQAFGKDHNLTTEEVEGEVASNPDLSPEERQRVLRNIVIIRMASNRRVDVTLSTTGQTSVRQFPFNATDALTLIGGRESEKKAAPKKPAAKPTTKKP